MRRQPAFDAMILSAGFGTRLAPLTDEIPKPLVPIGHRPLLHLSLESLHELGASSLIVNTHYHAGKISNSLSVLPFKVNVSHEHEILGTAGGVRAAQSYFSGAPLIIVNGDILGSLPVAELLAQELSDWTMALCPRSLGEGTVGVGSARQVVRLRGEVFGEEVASGDFMGVSRMHPSIISSLPTSGCLVGDWALPRLREGLIVDTVTLESSFWDIGDPRAYLLANLEWCAGAELIDVDVHIDKGVSVSSSVIGAGACVRGQGRVENCVILPGAEVTAPLREAVVTPQGSVIQIASALGLGPE